MSVVIAALIIVSIIIITLIIGALGQSEQRNYRDEQKSRTPVSQTASELRAQNFSAASLVITRPGTCTVYEWNERVNYNNIEGAQPVMTQRSCLFPNEAALSLDTMTCTINDTILSQFPQAATTCLTATGQTLQAGDTITQWNECGAIRPCTFKLARISLKWSGTYDTSRCITALETPSLTTCVQPNIFNDLGQSQTFIIETSPEERTFGDTISPWIALRSPSNGMYLSVQGDIVTYSVTPYYFLALPSVQQVSMTQDQPRAQTLGLVGVYAPALVPSEVYAYNAPALIEVDGNISVLRPGSRYTSPEYTSTQGLNIILL